MNLFTKQKWTQRKQTYDHQSGREEEEINQEHGINRYTLACIK